MLFSGIIQSHSWREACYGAVAVGLILFGAILVIGVENVSLHFTDVFIFALPAGLIGSLTARLGVSKGAFLFASLSYGFWGWIGMLIFMGSTNRLDRPVYGGPPVTPRDLFEIQAVGILVGLSIALAICWSFRRRKAIDPNQRLAQ